jgi:hypothetical protein
VTELERKYLVETDRPRRLKAEKSDHGHRRLLRARRERPRCRAAEQRDELAPSDESCHLILRRKCGSNDSTVLAAFPQIRSLSISVHAVYLAHMLQRTLPAGFIAPCLPTKTDKLPSGGQWLHEIKHDGFRVVARKDGERVRLYSRPGNELPIRRRTEPTSAGTLTG